MRMRTVLIAFGVLVAATIPSPSLATTEADNLLEMINTYRQIKGTYPLRINESLEASAQQHAEYIASPKQLEVLRLRLQTIHLEDGVHTWQRAIAQGYDPRYNENTKKYLIGENAVCFRHLLTVEAFNWWVESEEHDHNMLSAWKDVGIGIHHGRWLDCYVTDFGIPAKH